MLTVIAIIIAILLLASAHADRAAARDFADYEYFEELRHEELMELHKKHQEELKKELRKASQVKGRKRRISDCFGNSMEEILIYNEDEEEDG